MVKRLLPLLLVLCLPPLLAAPAIAGPIGFQSLEVSAVNQDGSPDVQAGSHPFALVTSFLLDKPEKAGEGSAGESIFLPGGGGLKDVRIEFPPGFAGNPNATPKCNYTAFVETKCPNDTAIGVAATSLTFGYVSGGTPPGEIYNDAVYNLEPPGGVAAEFGYKVVNTAPILIDASVRTGGDYGITVNVHNIPEALQVYGSTVRIWGVPEAPSHNAARGQCLSSGSTFLIGADYTPIEPHNDESSKGECPVDVPVQPLLTNPTSCGVPRSATMSVDGWGEPGVFVSKTASAAELVGCERLDFSPTINVTPDGTAGSTPTGLNVGVHVSQESPTNPEGLGEADVRDTVVTLPAGVQISPSASDGLQACSNAQIGFEGYRELDDSGTQTAIFTPGAPSCPNASKIANVRVATPLLEHELTGAIYLAAPQNFSGLPENPFSSLVAMYLVAEEPATGVLLKLPGKVSLNEATGQITTTFENDPQAPISDLKLEFYGTDRAPLTTPALCGTYNTESAFTPWSGTPTGHPP